ncbi:MAG: leucine--tRNA ligase [Clostridia bacterium]|nr:leucine--tRNA ligase [Clostridia bacterium]
MRDYKHIEIENKWKKYWQDNQTFKTDVWDFSKPKFYALDMFPYPSGSNLHAGHPVGYTATDIVARMKRMQGYNVLHPMGFDSFGLPAEQYAVDTGNHPDGFTQKNVKIISRQLFDLGFSYDWEREFCTSDPSYYKWTQWIFKKLYNDGLARCVEMPVNWCEGLGCVLANDEIIDGKSERGGFPVVRKNMKQWIIDTPKFADRLLEGLNEIDWPESTKTMQRNWIGKSTGVEVDFDLVGGGSFSIYTTCIETIYGITFMVMAPESKLVDELKPRIKNWQEVEEYRKETAKLSEFDRTELNKGKTGVKLDGVFAINPVNGREVPVFIGDFVLASYGTGAVMAVPSHDQRDFEYAIVHNIPMIQVIDGADVSKKAFEKQDYLGKGCKLLNSEEFTGLTVEEAKEAITEKLVKMGRGRKKNNYKLREWIFARQRYWGEPIPVVHFEDGTTKALEDKDLPLILPVLDDYKPAKDGNSPLAKATDWVNVVVDGKKAKRETSTMPGSAGSSWYFLRYIDPKNDNEFANQELLKHWMPVDLYVGGPEHAVGHLLYSRVWNNYLFDKGLVPVKEPFKKLVHQGMLLGANGIKMGKRYPKYVVGTDETVQKFGADSLRLYEMFMSPLEEAKLWSDSGIVAARKFLDRIYRIYQEKNITEENSGELKTIYNQTVKKVTEDYETLNFNTAISQMMIFINAVAKVNDFPREYAEGFVKLLNPICPFITEELWEELGHNNTVSYESWPTYDAKALVQDEIDLPVQILGKMRGTIKVNVKASQDEVVKLAIENAEIAKFVTGDIKKVIYVPGRILNLIV